MKKLVSLLLAILLLAALTVGGAGADSSGTGEKVKLVLASPGQDVDQNAFEKVIAEFYAQNPNIEVEAIAVPNTGWADYIAKIKTMIAGGNAPDVIRIAVQGIAEMVDNDLALPLDEFMAANPDAIDMSAFYPQEVVEYSTIGGSLYGFPWDANNVVLHVNTAMLEAAGGEMPAEGWTLDDFTAWGQSVSKEVDGQKVYAYAMPHNYFATSAWLMNNGASFFNDDMTECTIDSPEAVEVFQTLQDMIYKYGISPQPTPESNYTNQFLSGQVISITAGRWTQAAYRANGMNTVALVALPKLATNIATYGFGVYSAMGATKHPEEAKKLAAFMAGEFSQTNYLDGGSIPSISAVATKVIPEIEPVPGNYELFIKSPYPVKVVESPKQYSAVEAIFNRYYSQLLANEIDAQTMCEQMKSEIDSLL